MEIKPGNNIALTPAEARWIVDQRLSDDFRRRIERGRRAALEPYLPPGFFDGVVELAKDGFDDGEKVLHHIHVSTAAKALEAQFLPDASGRAPHPIEIEATEDEIISLYHHARHAYESAENRVAHFREGIDQAEAIAGPENRLGSDDQLNFEEKAFKDDLEDLQVASAVIIAIERATRQ